MSNLSQFLSKLRGWLAPDGDGSALTGLTSSQITDATSSATPNTLVLRGTEGEASFAAVDVDAVIAQTSGVGIAIHGLSTSGYGIFGQSVSGVGLVGSSGTGDLLHLIDGALSTVVTVDQSGTINAAGFYGDGSGLTGLKVTRVFADQTEIDAATPDFAGQTGINLTNGTLVRAIGTAPGDWSSSFVFGGVSIVPSGSFFLASTNSGGFISLSGEAATDARSISFPDASGIVALTTSNVATATTLETARNIFGISFNGSANVSGDATNAGHFASIITGGTAGHFIGNNGTTPTLIAGRSAWFSDGSGNPSFKNGTGSAVTLATTDGNVATATAALGLKTATTTVSVNSATAPTAGQALVATSSTAATWQTVSAGSVAVGSITGMGTGVATWLATPTSANLAAAVTDETGTGSLVFGTGPTITTPTIAQINAPSGGLTLLQGNSIIGMLGLQSTAANGYASVELRDSGGTARGGFGYANASAGAYPDQVYYYASSKRLCFGSVAGSTHMCVNISGGVSIGTTTDAGAGNLLVSGGVTATTLTFNGASATSSASGRFDISSGATARLRADGNGVSVSGYLSVGQTIAANEARLYPDAANILAQRNSTSAQTSRVYTTFTARGAGTTNLEAVEIKGQAAGNFIFQSLKGSAGGTARDIEFRHGATDTNGTITNGTLALTITSARVTASLPIKLPGYTFAALPAGSVGDTAYITDGAAFPIYRANAAGGGSAVTQVFFDGTNWINS